MMLTHELGHVCGAWATGGRVQQIIYHPLTFSGTLVNPNPSPLIVVWAGPIVGCSLPVVLWLSALGFRMPGAYLLGFVAGFCLIANGAYIGPGGLSRIADADDMLRLGSPPWLLWLFGGVTSMLGILIWHRISARFGFGRSSLPIRWPVAFGTLCAAFGAIALAALLGNRAG